MARMPGADWRPLPSPSKTKMARYDLVIIHTMVGSLNGTDGYFRGLTNGTNSHFGTGGAGERLRQWVDTAVRSGANGAGNHRSITIENADMGPGFGAWNTNDASKVPPFTESQIEDNAQICAWAHLEHGVPLVAADTSLPNARGIGFHKLGCDPYRVAGGEKWSSSYGKICPAPNRIAQIPRIIARARQIVAAGGAQEDDMAQADIDEIKRLLGEVHRKTSLGLGVEISARDPRERTPGEQVLKAPIGYGVAAATGGPQEYDAVIGEVFANTRAILSGVDVDEDKLVAALAPTLVPAVVAALGAKAGLTKEDVKEAVSEILLSLKSGLPGADAPDPR